MGREKPITTDALLPLCRPSNTHVFWLCWPFCRPGAAMLYHFSGWRDSRDEDGGTA